MIKVFSTSWALFLGMFLLMIGNGLQGTLLGLRGEIEGFSTIEISIVMSGYFLGFLGGSQFTPLLIGKVGHVRVFAALGSMISAVLIMYPVLAEPWAWTIGRVVIGFCFCGVYITAESWLNDASDNANRGQALSLYMIVQMAGIVAAQFIVTTADISGFILFIIPSVLVSLAFAPVLLSASKSPDFSTTKPMRIRTLIKTSPLACAAMFMLGGVFSAQFGMSAVYGDRVGLTVGQISIFVSTIYVAALVLQFPIGWLSDRMDRRQLIIALSLFGGLGSLIALITGGVFWAILVSGAIMGGTSNPLYALVIAYTNDYLEREDMAAASGGLLFVNGLGAVSGPLILGAMMDQFGPGGYWVFLSILMTSIALYALYRMTQRERAVDEYDSVPYVAVSSASSQVMVEIAQDVYIEAEEEAEAQAELGNAGGCRMTQIATPAMVRNYWLKDLEPKDWYVANDTVDAEIRDRFLTTWEAAQADALEDWLINADDLLAYLILCDQFPRNMFRGDGRSFATDAKARAATQIAIRNGWDLEIAEPERQFVYVTLMHSEDLADQDQAIEMFNTRMPLSGSNNAEHALAHRWVIATFGRFPYRNDALGRTTTPQEQAFLDAGGYGFAIKQVQNKDVNGSDAT